VLSPTLFNMFINSLFVYLTQHLTPPPPSADDDNHDNNRTNPKTTSPRHQMPWICRRRPMPLTYPKGGAQRSQYRSDMALQPWHAYIK
jgi:hypothetical protein